MALNEKDLTEFAQFLGINPAEVENLDKAKELLGNEFMRKSLIKDSKEFNDAVGSRFGAIEVAVKRLVKENGAELSAELIQGKKVEDVIALAETKLKETFSGKITELQRQIEDKDSSKIIEDWNTKYTALEGKHRDTEGLLTLTKNELENTKNNSLKTINDYKIKEIDKRSFDSISFSKDTTDLSKTGFKTILNEKYVIDLDEAGNPFVKDKINNARIPNPLKMGEFMTVEDVYKLEAEKNNLLSKVDDSKKDTSFVKKNPINPSASGNAEPTFNNPRRTTYKDRNG